LKKSIANISFLLSSLKNNLELIFWAGALLVLFFMSTGDSPSLCIFRFAGFSSCPGCGIGHSIHDALHLNFARSFSEHILGIPAVLIILHRIKQLLFTPKQYAS